MQKKKTIRIEKEMGKCKYCFLDAGFLSSSHRECEANALDGQNQITAFISSLQADSKLVPDPKSKVKEIEEHSKLLPEQARKAISNGLTKLADKFLEDTLLDYSEQEVFDKVFDALYEKIDSKVAQGLAVRAVKSITLRDISDGVIDPKYPISSSIIMKRGEIGYWEFLQSKYFKYKTTTTYVGKSRGVSVRIAKGLYYRTGSSNGHKISQENLVQDDIGSFIVTNQAIHFKGSRSSFRLNFDKIQSVDPWADAVEINDTNLNSRPKIFGVDDPVFAANLIMNLINLNNS